MTRFQRQNSKPYFRHATILFKYSILSLKIGAPQLKYYILLFRFPIRKLKIFRFKNIFLLAKHPVVLFKPANVHFIFAISQFNIVSSKNAILLFQYVILHRKSAIRQFQHTIRQFKQAFCPQKHARLHFVTIGLRQCKHCTLQFKPTILLFERAIFQVRPAVRLWRHPVV